MAAEAAELLRSFDHGCIHASTKAEAESLVDAGEFCYALLDLEIKLDADSIRARVEAGESVLGLIRQRYPHRNEEDQHLLPILMVSGHSDIKHIVRSFQQRADDFVAKPIGENSPPFKDKIEDALRKSGRQSHEDCAAIMRRARGDRSAAASHDAATRLAITARQQGTRLEIILGGTSILLTSASFVLLMQLVVARLRDHDSWVHKIDLGAKDEQGWKGMTRLKADLAPNLPAGVQMIENDGAGGYRLHSSVEIGPIDTRRFASIEVARIKKLVAEIAELQSSL